MKRLTIVMVIMFLGSVFLGNTVLASSSPGDMLQKDTEVVKAAAKDYIDTIKNVDLGRIGPNSKHDPLKAQAMAITSAEKIIEFIDDYKSLVYKPFAGIRGFRLLYKMDFRIQKIVFNMDSQMGIPSSNYIVKLKKALSELDKNHRRYLFKLAS